MAKRKNKSENLFEELDIETKEEQGNKDKYKSVVDEEVLSSHGAKELKEEPSVLEEQINIIENNEETKTTQEEKEKQGNIYSKIIEEKPKEEKIVEEIEKTEEEIKKEKIKKILIMGGAGVILGYFTFFTDNNDNENKIQNNETNTIGNQFKNKEQNIEFKETLKIEEINKNEDFIKVLNLLKRKVEDLENVTKESNSINIEKLNQKEYENFKKIEEYLFKRRYNVGQFEYFEKRGDFITHYLNKDDVRQISDRIILPFKDGMLVKIPEINTTYILVKTNEKEDNLNFFQNSFEIWKIDNKIGLKKVISSDEKRQTLLFLSEERENRNFIYERFQNKIVILGKNLEIEERIDIVNISEGVQLEEPKNIKEDYGLSGYIDELYNKYEIKVGEVFLNNKLITKKDIKYDYRIKKYETEKLEEKWVLMKYQNGLLVSLEDLNDIRKVYITNYKGSRTNSEEEVEYIEKNKEIYKVTKEQDLIKIGEGFIVGRILEGELVDVELDLYSEVYEPLELSQFLNKTLVLNDKSEYKVTEEGLFSRGKLTPLKEVIIGSNEYLYINKKKIGKIGSIKYEGKTGVKVLTRDYKITIRKENDFEIRDRLTNELKYSSISLGSKKMKFIISKNENSIRAIVSEDILVDFKNKTIDNIKYETYEQDVEGNYIIYNESGKRIKTVKRKKETFLFKQNIEDFELTKGELFDYFFEMDNKTGKVVSDEIGSIIKKYDKNNIPFKGFKKEIAKKRMINVTKNLDLSKSDLTKVKDLLKINTNKFTFKTVLDKNVKILDESNFIFDGQKILFEKTFYNKTYNEFVLLLSKNNNDSRVLKRAGIDYNQEKVKIKINQVSYEETEIINPKTNEVLIKFGKNYYYKINDSRFELVINIDFLFYDNKVSLMLENGEKIEINLEESKKLFEYLRNKYKKELTIQLTPKVKKKYESNFEEEKERILKEQQETFTKSLQNAKKELKEMLKEEVKKETYELNEAQIQEIKIEEDIGQSYDYMFEIGQKIRMKIKDSIEITEGETPFVMGYINNVQLRDLSGNHLRIENAKVLTEVEADFAKGKVFIKPVKIIYFHPELSKKVTIEIPNSATQFLYTEKDKKTNEKYQTVGIPGYVVRAKLKTLPTRVTLKTIGGAVENLTKKDDLMSSVTELASGTTGGVPTGGEDSTETMGETASAGVADGIKELVDTMTEIAEKEKDLIITEPDITGEILFMEEVEVILEEENKQKRIEEENKQGNKDKLKEKFNFTRK